ncbi:hypothetical protein [Peterkaempfera bronchialis]|uniref:Uncharacterized protein n=1 Tax=Peterkaempfera bronchialis TaxID=2126346 RepID=A0A345SRN6_9ACTN|nr:hypothetical protein [Peterkaempfera bronchialis]AXI76391.1 hypothetical protein C7M71_001745 [Peterkaempfera bronchialis]
MVNIEEIVRRAREQADADARERVRQLLRARPAEWLVEQLIVQTMGATGHGSLPLRRSEEDDRQAEQDRALRLDRIRAWRLDRARLTGLVLRYRELTRERLEAEGYLLHPPQRGGDLIEARHRSPAAAALLEEAKDLLYALLFGGDEAEVRLDRVKRELLTLTLPRAKSHTLAFLLRAATESGTEGTWRDPRRAAADDDRAAQVGLRVAYGETADALVGHGIAAALRLINHLEVNEPVLHARMENAAEGTLE